MDFVLKNAQAHTITTDCLIIPVFKTGILGITGKEFDKATQGALSSLLKKGDLPGALGQTLITYIQTTKKHQRILLVGTGLTTKDTISVKTISGLAKAISRALPNIKQAAFCIDDLSTNIDLSFLVTQSILAFGSESYSFNQYKSKAINCPTIKKITFISKKKLSGQEKKTCAESKAIVKGMNTCKDLGNMPPNICHPNYLASQAKKLAKQHPKLSIKVITEAEAKKLGMGAFVSVSQGSKQPGNIIIFDYKGGKKAQAPHMLVGKGITFDTGGISLKPGGKMDEMKYDMCGAASVFGTVTAIAEMQLPLNVVAIVVAAENMPSGDASRPGDIIKTLSGQTVEILNTDAEGRLVLCDALTYAERYKPASVVDIATLTGACVVALGSHASAVYSNNDQLSESLLNAGKEIHDRGWPMPLWDEYQEQINSPFADMANIGGPGGGSITAACFLSRFTKKYSWAHLDIAGTAWISGANKGATGRPVPLLTQYLVNKTK